MWDKLKIETNGYMGLIDSFRYAGAHIFDALVIILSLGLFRSNATHTSALKFARRKMKERENV